MFADCSNLTSISIPGSVASIGEGAFANCSKMTNALIANGVTNIADDAFEWCVSMTRITIPSSVISIGEYAFFGASLSDVYFKGNAPYVDWTNDFPAVLFDDTATVYYLPDMTGGVILMPVFQPFSGTR